MKTQRQMPGTGLLYTDAGGELRLRRYVVRVTEGPDRGAERVLEAGTLLVGSSADNDLQLTDSTVSRYHAELQLLSQGVRVRDVGSTNGTWCGEARIDSAVLGAGSEVRLGQTSLQIVAADVSAAPPPSERRSFGGLHGKSQRMREVFGLLERVAPTESSVLLEGESGTGKTTAARAIHDASPRAPKALVVLDAADTAFDPSAALAVATGGTLLLERVDELSFAVVPVLLGALEARERGELDVRFVSTTAKDLRERVESGKFRREVYFHLAGVRIVLPPLAARKDDIPFIARQLLASAGVPATVLSREVLGTLYAHGWPGNVRELRQLVERGLDLHPRPADDGRSDTAPGGPMMGLPFKEAKSRLIERFERAYLVELLRRHGGNVSQAAVEAGIDRNYIHRLVRRYGIRV